MPSSNGLIVHVQKIMLTEGEKKKRIEGSREKRKKRGVGEKRFLRNPEKKEKKSSRARLKNETLIGTRGWR